MKSPINRVTSSRPRERPSNSRPRSISRRAPAPIILRAESSGTGGSPSRPRTKLSALIRSGAVSTSVPSRSNTIVREEVIENRYRSARNHASRDDRLLSEFRDSGDNHAGTRGQDRVRDRRSQRDRVGARPGLCGGGHESDARRYRSRRVGGGRQK